MRDLRPVVALLALDNEPGVIESIAAGLAHAEHRGDWKALSDTHEGAVLRIKALRVLRAATAFASGDPFPVRDEGKTFDELVAEMLADD